MDLGDNGTLRSVFWAYDRVRATYIQFCGVLAFDVTYKTSKVRMPFAPFTGVNHYLHSLSFGCSLLEDETTEAFVWMFTRFRRCMFDRPPNAILLIRMLDAAICKVVDLIFPMSRHRYCMWHVRCSCDSWRHQEFYANISFIC